MWKLMTREDLAELWLLSGGPKSRVAYGIGKVKNQGIIESLGGWVYLINEILNIEQIPRSSEWQKFKQVRFLHPKSTSFGAPSQEWREHGKSDIDNLYWQMIALLIKIHAPSGAIIAHEKSMEYHLRDYSLPDRLVLYTRDTDKRIQIGKYDIHFRTLQSGEKSWNKNMYRILHDTSIEGEIDGAKLRFLSLESSLLDVASLRIHDTWVAEDLILRFLRKYETKLSRDLLGELVRYRYIRAMNRIRKIAKEHGFARIYEMSLDIIRREGGGCYLNL